MQFKLLLLALLVRVLRGIAAFFLLFSIGVNVNLVYLITLMALGEATLFVPFTISGMGIVETYFVIVFPAVLGVSVAQAATFALLLRFWTIVVHLTGYGVYQIKTQTNKYR